MIKKPSRNILLLILIYISLVGCKSPNVSFNPSSIHSFKVGEFSLELDEVSTGYSINYQVIEINGKKTLIVKEGRTPNAQTSFAIDFYDINTGKKINRIEIPKEGEMGVAWLTDVWFFDEDTGIINANNKLLVINSQGTLLKSIPLEMEFESRFGKRPVFSSQSPPIKVGETWRFFLNSRLLELTDISFQPQFIDINLKSESLSLGPSFAYPEKYLAYKDDDNYREVNHQVVDGIVYLSFPLTDMIYKLEGTDLVPSFELKSQQDQDFKYTPPRSVSGGILRSLPIGSANYYGFLFDPYRNLFYRFIRHSYPTEEQETAIEKSSILIADKEGNFLHEIEVKESEYRLYQSFIHPKGLALIGKNEEEDLMTFDIFDFSKLENQ
jgi:hypothetical protein